MLFSDVITLKGETPGVNAMGTPTVTYTTREIYADVTKAKRAEFYQAAAAGLKPEITCTIHTVDYEGETELTYDGKAYRVIRTYETDREYTELICEGVVNNG